MDLNEQSAAPVTAAEDNIPAARKAYTFAQLNLALFYVFYLLISIIVVHFMPEDPSETVNYLSHYIPMYLMAFPLYLLISRPLETAPPEKQKMSLFQLIKAFFVCEFIGIAGNLMGMIVNVILSFIVGTNTSSNFIVGGVFGDTPLLFIFLAVVCAPFVEEFLFRKILIDRIRKYGNTTAILISGIMFGLFHGNFTQAFYAAMLGMLFAFIYIRTGKIQYTIALHMSVNFWGTAMPYLTLKDHDIDELITAISSLNPDRILEMASSMKPFLLMVASTYLFAFIGMILLIVYRKKLTVPTPIAPLPKGRRFVTACGNIGFIALFAVCIYQFIRQFGALL